MRRWNLCCIALTYHHSQQLAINRIMEPVALPTSTCLHQFHWGGGGQNQAKTPMNGRVCFKNAKASHFLRRMWLKRTPNDNNQTP